MHKSFYIIKSQKLYAEAAKVLSKDWNTCCLGFFIIRSNKTAVISEDTCGVIVVLFGCFVQYIVRCIDICG